MALNNIISPKEAQENSKGQPLAGGFVYLYEPGTTTFITSYTDSDLVTPHQNPVRLSGSGRQNIWITRDCDIIVEDRNGNLIWSQDNANPDDLGGEATGGLVPNGSFEIVTTPPVPDSWVAIDEVGSSNAADSSFSTDGLNSYRFTSSGVGGGSLTTQDFFPVNDVDDLRVNFDLFSTLATVLNIVRVEWYDVTFISISNTDVYSSTANPLAWTEFQLVATPPALARFAKLKLIGIDPSVPLAGSTYFDRISVFYPTVVSGIFDNITIQNNEIISTNLNGEIQLRPNGTGQVKVGNGVGASDFPLVIVGTSNADPTVPDTVSGFLNYESADFNLFAQVGMDGEDFILRSFARGNGMSAFAEAAGGGARSLWAGNDFSMDLYDPANDTLRLATALSTAPDTVVGVGIQGETANNPAGNPGGVQDQVLEFRNSGLQRTMLQGFNGTIDYAIHNLVEGGDIILRTELAAAGGTEDVLQTTTAALGGVFVNNQLTGAGLERVLTTPGDASALLPTGTVTDASLRWDGAAWVEETNVRIRAAGSGELSTNTIRALGGSVIDIDGLDETDIGMRFNDGAKITFLDLAFANPVEIGNEGIGGGSGQLTVSAAGSFFFEIQAGTLELGDGVATFVRLGAPLAGPNSIAAWSATNVSHMSFAGLIPRYSNQAATPTTNRAAETSQFYPLNTVSDTDNNPYWLPGTAGAEHAIAFVNTKEFGNTNYNQNTAQNAERAINGTYYYDDGSNWTITLEPSAQTRIPIGSSFTVLNAGSGTITIAEGTGDTLFYLDPGVGGVDTLGGADLGPGGFCTVYRQSASDWFIFGAEITP